MAEKLVCSECGATYTDQDSIDSAKRMQASWEKVCKDDGVEPKGIAPCPNIVCRGELQLVEHQYPNTERR